LVGPCILEPQPVNKLSVKRRAKESWECLRMRKVCL
jgi:hypothetical protein